MPPIEGAANADAGIRFLNIVLTMENIPYAAPGIYSLRVLLDGEDVDGAPIEAVLAQS